MRTAWFVGRTQLRSRWGSVIVLACLVGLVGAVVLSSLAGARRASTALERFRDETLAPDLTIFVPLVDAATVDRLRQVPGVEAIGLGQQLTATVDRGFLTAIGGPRDDSIGRVVDRPRIVEGRRPHPDRVREVAVPEPLADQAGYGVGDSFTLHAYTPAQVRALFEGLTFEIGEPEGPEERMRIVGITRVPGDLSFEGQGGGLILTTPAFVGKHGDQIGSFAGRVLRVRTVDGDASRRFVQVARRVTAPLGAPGEFQVQPTSETEGAVRESIDVVAIGLVVFAIVAALAGLVVVTVAIRRFVEGGSDDLPALRGLGASRSVRTLALALAVVPIGIGGALIAVLGAWLASPLFPFGLARKAEPDLGFHADALVLGLGFLTGVALIAFVGWFSARGVVKVALPASAGTSVRPSSVSQAAVAAGLPPAVTVGVSAAAGRGPAGVPARPAIAGAVVSVLGVVAVAVVAASLSHLESTPATYGYNWDAHVAVHESERQDPTIGCSPARAAVIEDRAVAAAADTCADTIEIDGYSVSATAFMPLKGDIGPSVLEGRAPRDRDEIALGTSTLRRTGADIGDTVRVVGSSGTVYPYRVVGRIVLPLFSAGAEEGGDIQAVADGATLSRQGLARLVDSGPNPQARILIRWRDGVDVDAASNRIARLPGDTDYPRLARVPLEVERLGQVDRLPWLLGAFLAVIGVLGLGYGMVTSVRRRARDLAVLKTLGFRRGQVELTVATQATVYALVGLVVGIPLGVIVGRATWDRIAGEAGLAVVPIVSLAALAAVVLGTILIANVVAWAPARRAARLRPAVVLRSE
jgi:hypothetical protein